MHFDQVTANGVNSNVILIGFSLHTKMRIPLYIIFIWEIYPAELPDKDYNKKIAQTSQNGNLFSYYKYRRFADTHVIIKAVVSTFRRKCGV